MVALLALIPMGLAGQSGPRHPQGAIGIQGARAQTNLSFAFASVERKRVISTMPHQRLVSSGNSEERREPLGR